MCGPLWTQLLSRSRPVDPTEFHLGMIIAGADLSPGCSHHKTDLDLGQEGDKSFHGRCALEKPLESCTAVRKPEEEGGPAPSMLFDFVSQSLSFLLGQQGCGPCLASFVPQRVVKEGGHTCENAEPTVSCFVIAGGCARPIPVLPPPLHPRTPQALLKLVLLKLR